MNNAKAAAATAILVMTGAVLACSSLGNIGKKAADVPISNAEPARGSTFASREWKPFELAGTDIAVELPGAPRDQTPPLPPAYREIFSAMHIHSFDEGEFASSYSELVPATKRKWQIKDLADTSMTALKRQIANLQYSLDIRSDSNAKITGTFTRNQKKYELRGCCIYKKPEPSRVWAVLTLYPTENADLQAAAGRIIDSVVFKNSQDTCK